MSKGTLRRLLMSQIRIYFIIISPLSILGFVTNDIPVKNMQKTALLAATPTPIDPSGWPDRFPAKDHCSKCGLCETSFVSHVSDACAFLDEGMARMDRLEVKVHGRRRNTANMVWSDGDRSMQSAGLADEGRFGVLYQPMMLARGVGIPNAQWTGCVTGIALSMLESGTVDAVVCIANERDSNQWSSPEPIIAKTRDDVLRGRGVKPALAPSLRVLDEIKRDSSIRRLLFCGVGCAVQGTRALSDAISRSIHHYGPILPFAFCIMIAFRAVQHELDLDEVYVLGTNCADNSPTPEAAQNFIKNGVNIEDSDIRGYEFMQVSYIMWHFKRRPVHVS